MATCINHSRMTDEWIRTKVQQNPIVELPPKDPTSGETFLFTCGPVRLSYPHLLKPFIDKKNLAKPPKYNTALWFTPFHQLDVLYAAGCRLVAAQKKVSPDFLWQHMMRPIPGKIADLNTPFRDQVEKAMAGEAGYTPGCMFMNASSDRPVRVQRISGGQRVDMTAAEDHLLYGGMWGIPTVNLYISRENKQEQIPARLCAGLNSMLIFADDERIGGGAQVDPDQAYGSVQGAEEIGSPPPESGAGGYGGPAMPGAAGPQQGYGPGAGPTPGYQPMPSYGQPPAPQQGYNTAAGGDPAQASYEAWMRQMNGR